MDKRGTGHINRVYRGGAGMAKAEFGIIEDITETREYMYNPGKYHCVLGLGAIVIVHVLCNPAFLVAWLYLQVHGV